MTASDLSRRIGRAPACRRLPRAVLAVLGCLALISCAAPRETLADAEVRVLVLGEDGGRYELPRSTGAFERVTVELQEAMRRQGFDVVDEHMIAADLGWWWSERRDKIDLMEVARLANDSERARNRVRAVVTFSIEASLRRLSFTDQYAITVRGRIYDAQSNRYLGAYELPSESFPGPKGCQADTCASQVVGERARDIATSIGAVLARRLSALADRGAGAGRAGGGGGLENVYTVTLRHLDAREAAQVIAVMTEEFPGYKSHELIRSGADLRKYEYETTASAAKLERWLGMLLLDMGLPPEDKVELVVRDGSISIERMDRAPARRRGSYD